MIGEHRQEEAISFVLGDLSAPEAARFHEDLARDEDLRQFVREMEAASTSLALSTEAMKPRDAMWSVILSEVRASAPNAQPASALRWIPWAVAACFAIACAALGVRQAHLQQEVAGLRAKDELTQVRIATLAAQIDAFSRVGAVVVWDAQKQRGVAELTSLPPLDEEHDYQLWIIDPAQPHPVSAGVVFVEPNGSARLVFQPVLKVEAATQFAISVERKGGTPSPQGQIVLAGK